MSQEEEKLIERYEEIHKILMAECHSDVISNLSRLIISLKIEAYRSGKLAGFEMWKKFIPSKISMDIDEKGISAQGYNLAIEHFVKRVQDETYKIKSLIEEEKKKL